MTRDSWLIEVVTKIDGEQGEMTRGHMENVRTQEIWPIGPVPRNDLQDTIERIWKASGSDAG
jgi:hypothetical protein